MNEERFQLLVEKYLERRISDEEARELLEAPEPFRARILDEVTLANLLARVDGGAKGDLAGKIQAALRPQGEKDRMVARIIDRLPDRASRRRWGFLAAAAALVAIGLTAWLLRPGPVQPPTPVVNAPKQAPVVVPGVKEAVDRAVAYLRSVEVPGGSWHGPVPGDELALLALHHAGVGQEDPRFQALLKKALGRPLTRTYTVSLQALLLRDLDPVFHRARIAECAEFLVRNQNENGQWAYGAPAPVKDGKVPPPEKGGPGAANNSCSLFAAMGLRACAEAGVAVPEQTILRARASWLACQQPDKDRQFGQDRAGWCYWREEPDHHPYGSMTAGGLAALVTLDHLAKKDWRKNPAVRAGLNWLTYHYTVHENYGPVEDLMAREILSDTPSPMTEFYYYLWALERAATVTGTAKFGKNDWYFDGVQEILSLQRKDGSWYSGVKRCNPVWDTCFAILFLTRSTRPLEE